MKKENNNTCPLERESITHLALRAYAREIMNFYLDCTKKGLSFDSFKNFETKMLCGACCWEQYSRDGNSLVWHKDIIQRCFGHDANIKDYIGMDLLGIQAKYLSAACCYAFELLVPDAATRTKLGYVSPILM